MVVSDVAQDFTGSGGPDLSQVPLWIGLNDEANDPEFGGTDDGPGGTNSQHAADFTWVDGSTAAYRNWNVATNEPNDDGGEYYAALNWHYATGDPTALGTWNDTPNTGTAGYGGNTGNDTGYFGIAYVPEPTSALAALSVLGFLDETPDDTEGESPLAWPTASASKQTIPMPPPPTSRCHTRQTYPPCRPEKIPVEQANKNDARDHCRPRNPIPLIDPHPRHEKSRKHQNPKVCLMRHRRKQ